MAKTTQRRGTPRPGQSRGTPYGITDDWRRRIKARIAELGWTEKDLAKRVGCSQSTMHDIINDPATRGTSRMPKIHAVLGWDPPALPLAPQPLPFTSEALELAKMFDTIPDDDVKAKIFDDARMYLKLLGIKA